MQRHIRTKSEQKKWAWLWQSKASPAESPRSAAGFESLEDRVVLSQGSSILPPEEPEMIAQATVVPSVSATVEVDFKVVSDWQSGFTGSITITNTGSTAINGWQLELDFGHRIGNIWNAVIVSQQGNRQIVKDAGYNATVAAGATISFGFNGSPGNVTTKPTNYVFNGLPVGPSTPPVVPGVSISDVSVTEGDPQSAASGFFHTEGNQIVDANGQSVRIAGVNWFGMETTNYAPHGLWTRGYKEMMDQMKELGFNTIRLPYSSQLFDSGSTPNGIDFSKNPDLVGLNGLGIMDKIVEYAEEIGLRILLDHHRSAAGNSANENGLWYTAAYSESRWISDWVMLAQRYAGNATVIGADLHNEPHGPATWGSGNQATDWRLAAERAGNAILAVNPDWLIVVEGIEAASSGNYWWGGNLSNAGQFPVRLNIEGRLVYSPHDYPQSVYDQSWFSDPSYPNNLPAVWDANWGYLFRTGTAPILIGEFGSRLETNIDRLWAEKLADYLAGDLDGNGTNDLPAGAQGVSWTYWSWNPNSSDTGGILQDDWRTVHQNKIDLLAPVQFQLDPPGDGGSTAIRTAVFTVTLSQATTVPVTLSFATADGTAKAGTDYLATSGSLTFAPGETQKTISVRILSDLTPEGTETFFVRLSSAANGTIADGEGVGTILDDDSAQPTLPVLTVGDVSISEGDSGTKEAAFVVRLSAPSASTVTVAYATADQTATAGSDYVARSGTITFAPGEVEKTIYILINGDTAVEGDERFVVNLSNAANATIGDGQGVGTIANDDVPPPSIRVGDVLVNESGGVATFLVTLSAASTKSITVQYLTANDTAMAGTDYQSRSGTLTFAPGETSKQISIPIIDDTFSEPDEVFRLLLSSPTNAVIGDGTGLGTIRDNDAPPASVAGTYNVRSDWGAGFVADLSLTNNQSTTVDGWTIELELSGTIVNIWGAEIVSRVGNKYVIRAASWNRTIRPGQQVNFGFQVEGTGSREPTNVLFNGIPIDLL